MSEKFGNNLTVGSIPRHLLIFSVPMLIGNLIYTGYSLINTIWVGNIVGENGVGAIAVSIPIVLIMFAIISGLTLAISILVSQHYGAENYEMVERVVNNSITITLMLGTVLTALGIIFSDHFLKLVGTPIDIFAMASGYLKISIAGFPFMFFAFLIISMLRGIGDTVTPMVFMVISIALNAILDPLLIIGVGPFPKLGLNGAAYASLIAQGTAVLLALIYLNHKDHLVTVDPRKFIFDKQLSLLIFKIGMPSVVQQSLVAIGTIFITYFVNSFGPSAIDAFGAALRVEQIAVIPAFSLNIAVAALTAQNLGANKPERIKEVFKWGVIYTSVITVLISVLAVSFPGVILSAMGFTKNSAGFDIGVTYLRIVGGSYILYAIMYVANGIINGAGHTIKTMIISLFSLWVIRVPLAAILSKTSMGIIGIWVAIVISYAVVMTISLIYYFSGRWKKAVVNTYIQPEPEFE
ncbi:MAG: MATE family efflux transporter [Desulfosporosinus sp.]|nr:MATE family efflux transporter [Desulfosporosinus sp.]